MEELATLPELRRWQVAELGPALLQALREVEASSAAAAAAPTTAAQDTVPTIAPAAVSPTEPFPDAPPADRGVEASEEPVLELGDGDHRSPYRDE
jgi:hypothetical protein